MAVIMMHKELLVLTILCCLTQVAQAAEVDIVYGQFRPKTSTSWTTQVIAAKNNGAPIRVLEIECGFFDGNALLAADRRSAMNVAAGQTVYVEVFSTSAANANRAECRVSDIER